MKTMFAAALVLLSSAAVAQAEVAPANSTNQHQRDSADFYDSVPDFSLLTGERTSSVATDSDAADRG
ncbi:hypothetical protein [Hansschlegelia zhihuaiae]|uniref:DUF680 domain-containing protein n=1 Tax=Hansschlegelia zhihuaiae TaxID=405005 RepID=A0A4Q0MIR2_9HYPH|nr:hypothetical protein [Hansschlegelia zhihuaiae]RXF72939.1 hypothetical protein EK403_12395 [Hansschlegelia zhihuaiae]